MKLEGKVAIVTGGGGGIGQGIALCLAEEGANLVIIDMLEDNAQKVAAEVKALGRKSLALQADVMDNNQVIRVVQKAVDTFGKIDILVNNVGGGGPAKHQARHFVDITEEAWDYMFALNVKTQFLMCRAVVPYFLKQKSGKIVNIGSWVGQRPGNIKLFAYSIAKAASIHLTRLLATELAPNNINVNCVCPGDVLTIQTSKAMEAMIRSKPELAGKTPVEFFTEWVKPRTPLQRLQTPEDMGHAVVFLVSEDSRNVTGLMLNVDGGQVMQ